MAVVGAAMVAAWSVGAGAAQADDNGAAVDPGCGFEELTSVDGGWVPPAPIPCHPEDYPSSDAIAQIGCDGPAVLSVEATGLEPGEEVSLLVDSRTRSEVFVADEDGVAYLFADFAPRVDGYVNYDVEYADGNPAASGEEIVENTCGGTATVAAHRICTTPESLDLLLSVSGLEANADYEVDYFSAGFVLADGTPADGSYVDFFTTDGSGAATLTTTATEDDEVVFADGPFSVEFEVYGDDDVTTSIVGQVDVVACTTAGGAAPSPTTPAPTTPVTAPVVVTHPAVAQPAVLANTGTPVTAAALLGGGLLVAGAGVLVATRRRAS